MVSNVCKLENGSRDIAAILKECEKVAVYNELTHKQSLQLRLLCEEVGGMLPNIIDDFNGELWIELNNGECKVNVSLRFDGFTAAKKEELIKLSKNKKNAAVVGISGKIRDALENFFLDEDTTRALAMSAEYAAEYNGCVEYSHMWCLEQYRETVNQKAQNDDWDELEKSVIASVADDVIVGVKGKQADITIVKKFA